MFVDFIHNSSVLEKIRFFAWCTFAMYMLIKFSFWLFAVRVEQIDNSCLSRGGIQTQMFVVLEGEVVNICLRH